MTSNAEVAKELLDLDGRRVIDIGCGEGKLTRTLARQGAEAFRESHAARSEKRRAVFDARGEEIRERFLKNARQEDGGFGFDQPTRVNLLSKRA